MENMNTLRGCENVRDILLKYRTPLQIVGIWKDGSRLCPANNIMVEKVYAQLPKPSIWGIKCSELSKISDKQHCVQYLRRKVRNFTVKNTTLTMIITHVEHWSVGVNSMGLQVKIWTHIEQFALANAPVLKA